MGGRHTWGNRTSSSSLPPQKVLYRLTWNAVGAAHMPQEQDTESPGQPHGGAVCAQQGACSKKHRAQGQRQPSRAGGQNLAGLGAGSLGIPLWLHVCGNEGQQYLLWRGQQEENERVEGRRLWGKTNNRGAGCFSLRS